MKALHRSAARSVAFSRPRHPSRVRIASRRASSDDAPRCLLCDATTHPWLVSATGAAVCETCAVDAHAFVDDADAACAFCVAQTSPLRGHAERPICEACLSFARAIVLGDV